MDLIVFRRQMHVIDSAYDSEKKFNSLPVVGLQGLRYSASKVGAQQVPHR